MGRLTDGACTRSRFPAIISAAATARVGPVNAAKWTGAVLECLPLTAYPDLAPQAPVRVPEALPGAMKLSCVAVLT